ncbi:hypothetical protein KVR01_010910 [Diaporthe batatas]|uniref:uncharacterized protein n=1 Tax=Diaporthe batatas TaxID=748121 RepID=UPI001D04AEA3|nr:uncharacterized protein KVR01_010910 [Diaporthe batatas]KAG8159249.1 hypothetical protein KVR01_010910 [Diaporthe batatas]
MRVLSLRVSQLPLVRVALASLKNTSRGICTTTKMAKPDHSERTAAEPRDPSLHTVILKQIDEVNPSIRTFRLSIPPSVGSIKFLPGQWLDVFVPGISKPGGFTITSAPSKASSAAAPTGQGTAPSASPTPPPDAPGEPYLELAVQKSPDNPPAQYLWRPAGEIISSELRVRVGGSFVWPPPGIQPMTLRKIVFVAGGVGINPLMSIVSHLAERPDPRHNVEFLYATRDPGEGRRNRSRILYLDRLHGIFNHDGALKGRLRLFLTPGGEGHGKKDVLEEGSVDEDRLGMAFKRRRITIDDIADAIGDDKRFAAVYICGVPTMTDEFVNKLTSPRGLALEPHRVLYEKWW